jgi:hypothetical protein
LARFGFAADFFGDLRLDRGANHGAPDYNGNGADHSHRIKPH